MTALAPDLADMVDAARQYAALSGLFVPFEALPPSAIGDMAVAGLIASALAADCDTSPEDTSAEKARRWLMRTSARHYVIETLASQGRLAEAVAARRQRPGDADAYNLIDALGDCGAFTVAAIAADLDDPAPPRQRIEAIVAALDRAGPPAPAYTLLLKARSVLAGLDRQTRRAAIAARGFYGRDTEIADLVRWFETPLSKPPARAALLSGLPGIGKSALLEEMTAIATDRYDNITIRLDFDRAGLTVLDLLRLTMEVARQVSDRLGDAGKPLVAARLVAGRVERGSEQFVMPDLQKFPAQLAATIGDTVKAAGRPVLLVLDTLEVLRARGDQHPVQLFDWIDQLLAAGLRPLRIIAAGRGDALACCPERIGHTVALTGLDDAAALMLLDKLGVPAVDHAQIVALAGGNPLVLRLAADVVRNHGAALLPQGKLENDVAAAFLYRILLSRIDNEKLCKLAHPGLIVRRLSAAFLREALADAVGLPPPGEAEALDLFATLAAQHWLVEPDIDNANFVRHRSDMRSVLLPLLYADKPDLCARVNHAAADWFDRQPGDAARVDALYHRLQLGRSDPAMAPTMAISATIAAMFDDGMLAELPEAAQDAIRTASGRRSSKFRSESPSMAKAAGAPPAPPVNASMRDDAAMAAEILGLVDRQDWAEGDYVVRQVTADAAFAPDTATAAAIIALRWRAGQWQQAHALLRAHDRHANGDPDADLVKMPALAALARLEMRAEFQPERLPAILALDGIGDTVALQRKLSGGIGQQGALGFQLAALLPDDAGVWSERDGDAIGAAFERYAARPDRGRADFALGLARERLAARNGNHVARTEWNEAQLLATLSPYAPVASTLALQRRPLRIENTARKLETRLLDAGALFDPPAPGITPMASNPIAGIAGIGLFAEWATAQGFITGDSNLWMIGRRAEAWRRTVAGDWRYGARPLGWQPVETVDASIARRQQRLAQAGNPRAAALTELSLWTTGGDGERLHRRLERHFAVPLHAARAATTPHGIARILLDSRVPSAFVPALATLREPNGDPQ